MTRYLAFLTTLVLLLAAGLVHGLWSERWQPSDDLERAAARVEAVPLDAGDWTGKDVEPLDHAAFAQAGARAYWMRIYTHRRDGSSVLVVLMCGRAGRMAVHTPEVCYRGAGYEIAGAPVPYDVRGELGEELGTLWTAQFTKQAGTTRDLRLYWGWGDGGRWQAPASPRWEFRGEPYLYKLYVSHEPAGGGTTSPAGGPATEFLQQFLPELRGTLLPTEG